MKNILFLFVLLTISSSSCTTNSEADVFIGEWADKKNPANTWKIEKNGSTFVGTRTGAVDFYKEVDKETWKVFSQKNLIQLKNEAEGGSALTYIFGSNEIMRHPPGIVYKKLPSSTENK